MLNELDGKDHRYSQDFYDKMAAGWIVDLGAYLDQRFNFIAFINWIFGR